MSSFSPQRTGFGAGGFPDPIQAQSPFKLGEADPVPQPNLAAPNSQPNAVSNFDEGIIMNDLCVCSREWRQTQVLSQPPS